MTRGRPKHDDILTPREWDVLALLREGLTNEEIAARLGISANTAKYHVAAILAKLDVSSREAAAAWQREPALSRVRHAALAPLIAIWKYAQAGVAGKVLVGGVAVGSAGLFVFAISVLASRGDDAGPLGKIAYVQSGDIWVKGLPDGTPRRLTQDGQNSYPAWSPSGQWLAFTHGENPRDWEGWVVSSDGHTRRRIDSPTGLTPQWSPVADEVLSFRPDGVVVEAADGSNQRVVLRPHTSATEAGLVWSTWSPDGKRLMWWEERWHIDPVAATPSTSGQFPEAPNDERTYVGMGVVAPDGSGRKELVALQDSALERMMLLGWSGDGASLFFTTIPRTWTVEMLDGVPLRAVSVQDGAIRDLGATLTLGTISSHPGSARIAAVIGDQRETWTNKQVASIDGVAGTVTPLTDAGMAALSPSWSPDGNRIAYVSAVDAGADARDAALASRRIWIMNADGSNKRQVTDSEQYRDEAPQWSADGTRVLFARVSNERCNPHYSLALLDLEDGSVEPVLGGFSVSTTRNARPVIGEVPECPFGSGKIGDHFGRIGFGSVFDWWQAPANSGSAEARR